MTISAVGPGQAVRRKTGRLLRRPPPRPLRRRRAREAKPADGRW